MKQRHNPDARAYHEYYLNQAGRGYPVYVGTRYQRGHGLGSIFGSLFKSAVPLLKGGTQLYLSHIQSHFLDLDFITGASATRAKASRLLLSLIFRSTCVP
jgi:hypothetical protein